MGGMYVYIPYIMSIYRIPYFLRYLQYFDVCPNDSYFVIKIFGGQLT